MPHLPPRPDLDQLRHQARDLLRAARGGEAEAVGRLVAVSQRISLSAAQLSIARLYGFPSWPRLKLEVEMRHALDTGDLRRLTSLLTDEPELIRAEMARWSDHPLGVTALGYVAMLRFDTSRHVWRSAVGSGALARLLLAAGAPVDGPAEATETPLITAASYGDADVARVLILAGADLEATAADNSGGVPGGTALLHAAVFGMTDVVDVLVSAGARVRGIEEAAAAGDLGRWLTTGTSPDSRIRALVMAADHQRLNAMDRLLAEGTQVDGVDPRFGGQPLRTAAANGRPASVARLLGHGADPDLRDPDGRTALELCRRGRASVEDRAGHDRVEAILAPLTAP